MKIFPCPTLFRFLLVLGFMASSQLFAQQLVYQSAFTGGQNGSDEGTDVAVDPSGNSISVGFFVHNVDFDPHPVDSFVLSTQTGATNGFVQKLDANGNFLWAFSMGSSSAHVRPFGVTTDQQGNIYVTGWFTNTVDFDPDPNGVVNLSTFSGFDPFIQKLTPTGQLVWARSLGGSGASIPTGIAVDNNGNVYSCGYFNGTIDFDPGSGTVNATTAGDNDYYVHKLDANGDYQWGHAFGSPQDDRARSIDLDPWGNVIVTGHFEDAIDFDPGSGIDLITSYGPSFSSDIFVQKLDASGNHQWVARLGSNDTDEAHGVAVDHMGSAIITGRFRSTADFDPGTGTVNKTANGYDVFVCKVDSAGNYGWVGHLEGLDSEQSEAIDVDAAGNVYTLNTFSDSVDFDPGPGTHKLVASANTDIALLKLDNNGGFVSATRFGGMSAEWGKGIAVSTIDQILLTGYFQTELFPDPNDDTTSVTGDGSRDLFTIRLSQCSPYAVTDTISACVSYTWIDSVTYMASNNTATYTLTTALGCDSMITLDLTINQPTSGTDVQTACGSFTWIDSVTYTNSVNNVVYTLPNAAGCDSVVTLDLTINTVETGVTASGITLTADADSATYQWVDCDNNFAPISNATDQSFTATANGNYAVIVTQDGCSDTSACESVVSVGLNELTTSLPVRVFPNPVRDAFQVVLPEQVASATITVYGVQGNLLLSQTTNQTQTTIQPENWVPGVYMVQVVAGNAVANQLVLVVD